VLSLALALSPAAHAEISDKITPLPIVWVELIVVTAFAYVAARFRPWLVIAPLLAAAVFLMGIFDTYSDRAFTEALRHEQGAIYEVSLWVSGVLPFIAAAFAFVLRRRSASRAM
jgi:hypothetical protein